MRFVGVDLAWTTRGRTGLCAIEDGVVTASTTVTGDGELMQWLEPRSRDDVLMAIDAPLILRNETGRRPCDQPISRCFGRYEASTHSANLRLPSFRDGVRAELLARALDIGVDPNFETGQPVRRAIEVYPHPAIVALFDLPKTLKYKDKRGRTVESRKLALVELLVHIESLRDREPALDVGSVPRWSEIVRAVNEASAPIHLSRVEDEIDSYVCAYIALYFWTHGAKRCRVAGNVATGYIVTPVSPAQALCLDSLTETMETAFTKSMTASESLTEGYAATPATDATAATSTVTTANADATVEDMSFEDTLAALLSLLGEQVIVTVQAEGAKDDEHVAALHGALERGHDCGAYLRRSVRAPGAVAPDPMPAEREAILFKLTGQDGGFCLRPEQFTRAAWVEIPDREIPSTPRRELVIALCGVEIVVEPVKGA